jgi:hypothetical protein
VALLAATQTLTAKTINLTSNTLVSTSLQLLTALTDETGTGLAVFATSPAFTTNISTPAIITASGALTVTPASGSGITFSLATTGDFIVNTDDLVVDTSAGFIGIGMTAPTVALEILSTAQESMAITRATGESWLRLGRPGTAGDANVIIGWNDTLKQLQLFVSGDTDGEGLNVQNGNIISIGTTASSGRMVVDQFSTTAALPVISLEQRDIDQDWFEFDTTIGTGNATEAVGAKVLTTTHFLAVTITGVGVRYFPVGTIA